VVGPSYLTLAFGFVVAITDAFDGWLARRWGTTRSGAFLDPLADKVLVLGAMGALVVISVFPVVPVALIAVRELGISAYRSYWGRRGLAVPARAAAKFKTVVQEFAVAFALMPHMVERAMWVPLVVLWAAVALTLGTGASYLIDGRRALSTGGSRS
jgi:CDP-diacylglycerol---glycerol-3-phosphate 3-phosphatidyltransferase